jgi:hypothetical protein
MSVVRPIGCRGYVRTWLRTIRVLLVDRSARQFAGRSMAIPSRLLQTTKFGLYVGRKRTPNHAGGEPAIAER